MRSYALLTLALYLFVIAQFLPALSPDMGAWNNSDKPAVTGWLITALAWPFYVPNVILLLGPLLVAIFTRFKRARLALGFLVALYVLTPVSVLAFRDAILGVAVGFYFWVASYLASALGAVFAMPPSSNCDKTQ